MELTYHTLIMAGLFHDLDKFLPLSLVDFIEKNARIFSHVTDIALFKQLVAPVLNPKEESLTPKSLLHLISILKEADRLSIVENSPQIFDNCTLHRKKNPEQYLHSLFSRLTLDKNEPELHLYRRLPLNPTIAFPVPAANFQESNPEALADLFLRAVQERFSNLNCERFDIVYTHWLALLQEFVWCIPINSFNSIPDVSLYEHLKTTSALAAALYQYHEASDFRENEISAEEEKKFRLVIGDLSGIQSYIFDISGLNTGGVAKRLRARSFYLTALTDVISHRIIHDFNLPLANILISSGGKFYLLLPNLPETATGINHLQEELDNLFLNKFNGELVFNLGHDSFSSQEFSDFPKVFNRINEKLQQRKSQSFRHILINGNSWNTNTLIRNDLSGSLGVCEACAKMPADKIVMVGGEPKNFCFQCRTDLELGRKLTQARYLIFQKDGKQSTGFPILAGYSVDVRQETPDTDETPYLTVKLNSCELKELSNQPAQFRFLANYIPLANENPCEDCQACFEPPPGKGDPLYLDCLAFKAQGRKLLGYLKADVDMLGTLFVYGFPQEGKGGVSIARTTTLSRMLDMFFSGWLEEILRKNYPYCYTVFSGGDDLLVIGPWDQTVDLALTIRKEFSRYTGENPNVTLSAGISLAKPKHPVAMAVAAAEEYLDNAKEKPAWGESQSRNQLTFLEDTICWKQAEDIITTGKQLAIWLNQGKISAGFVQNLVLYGEMFLKYKLHGDTQGLMFLPMLNYDIARNLQPDSGDREKSEIFRWAGHLNDINNATLIHLKTIATYALMLTRRRE